MRREGPGFALDGAGFGFVVAVEFVLLFELPPLLMLVEFVVLPFPLLPLPLPFVLHSFEASSGEWASAPPDVCASPKKNKRV